MKKRKQGHRVVKPEVVGDDSTALVTAQQFTGPIKALVFYNSAKTALKKAHKIDEVKNIRNKAEAMRAYAVQARDDELLNYAVEIRMRAERRAGEMIVAMMASGELDDGRGGDRKSVSRASTPIPTLPDVGVTRDESSLWQSYARPPDEAFDRAIAESRAKGSLTAASMLRELRAGKFPGADAADEEFTPPKGLYDLMVIAPPFATLSIPQVQRDVTRLIEGSTSANAHVFFWVSDAVHKYLPEIVDLVARCSLDYLAAWLVGKPGGFQPFLMYTRKGSPKMVKSKFSVSTAKPDYHYDLLRAVIAGRRLDAYGVHKIRGFDRWPS